MRPHRWGILCKGPHAADESQALDKLLNLMQIELCEAAHEDAAQSPPKHLGDGEWKSGFIFKGLFSYARCEPKAKTA